MAYIIKANRANRTLTVKSVNRTISLKHVGRRGLQGETGAAGVGVPTGGTAGQILTKDTGTDYDTSWQDPTGTVDSVNGQTGTVVLDQDDIADGTTYKQYSATEKTKLAGIEALADVTDATNVAAAGAVMEADTSTSPMSFVVDEDNMASDLATKVPTQQSTKAYVDDAVTVTEMVGAAPYRSKYLDNWFTRLKDSNTSGPVDIIIVGDSIASGSSTDSPTARGWGWKLSDLFARKDFLSRYPDTPAVAQVAPDGWTPALADWGKTMTTCQGTATAVGFGRYSSTMTHGQIATHTATMDAVSVLYNMSPTGGQIEVRDGVGGTLLATIETNGTAVGAQMWTSSALTYGSRTIELTAVCGGGESVVLNGVYCYSGNLTRGVRVWPAARAGINTDTARTDTTFFLDFVDTIDPDLIVLATGANDSAANYTSRMQALIDDTRARTSADIALWGCYPITRLAKYLESQSVLARDMALDNNMQIIDAFLALPDMRQSSYFRDSLHPNDKGVKILAWHAYSILSGDPIGFTLRELSTKAEEAALDTLTATVATKAPIASPTFTGTVTGTFAGNITGNVTGAITLANGAAGSVGLVGIFGYPGLVLYNAAGDANVAMAFFGAGFSALVGYGSNATLVFGAGGASSVDAGLGRTGISELTFFGTGSGNKSKINIADPTGATHAATKGYTDTLVKSHQRTLTVVIDGSGSAITTGAKKVYASVPYAGTIKKWRILALDGNTGSIQLDIWKDTYANFAPTVADTITASAKPSITASNKNESTTLTGWTTSIAAGDILEVNVDSASTFTKIKLELFIEVVA